jgi:Na+-driven multidrug efflux pump
MPTDPAISTTPTIRQVFDMTWPLTLKSVMLHAVMVVDAYLVAPLGETTLAAMGTATSVTTLFLGILSAFSAASQIKLAQAYGSRGQLAIKSAFVSGLVLNMAIAAIGCLMVLAMGDWMVGKLAHTPEIAVMAKGYIYIFLIVLMAEAACLHLTAYFNATGLTRYPLYGYVISLPVNVTLSMIFIYGYLGLPAMGLAGAALGSAIGSAVQLVFLSLASAPRMRANLILPGWRHGNFPTDLQRNLMFALPIAATFGSATLANSVCMMIYSGMEINAFAALTLIMPWINLAGSVGMSWAQASGIIIAQLLGERREPQALDDFFRNAWRAGFVVAALVSAIYAVICLLSPWLYPDLRPQTHAILLGFLGIMILIPIPKQSNAMCGNTLRAGGDTVYVMMIFVCSQWLVRVPATALFVLYLDLSAAWVLSLLLLDELVKFLPFHARLRQGKWKHFRDHPSGES